MSLLFRLLYTLIAARFRPRCAPLDACRTPFRVWLNDIDLLMHMNNGRYLTLMDLARTDLSLRSELYGIMKRRRWYPVVAAETIQFIKPMSALERFEIETQVVGWDKRAFLLRQRFLQGTEIVADAVMRARFLTRAGESVDPDQLLQELGYAGELPEPPAWISRWSGDQATQRRRIRAMNAAK